MGRERADLYSRLKEVEHPQRTHTALISAILDRENAFLVFTLTISFCELAQVRDHLGTTKAAAWEIFSSRVANFIL